jgi:glycerol uptake facilitator-like aquaporin
MDSRLRSYLAELLGTFVLVYVSAGAVCAFYLPIGWKPEVTGIALAQGCVLAILVSATSLISEGCCNPAITLTLYVFRRFERTQTLLLIGAQLFGAVVAGLALCLTFSADALADAHFGTPHLGLAFVKSGNVPDLGALVTGVALEAFFTALVTFAVFVSLIDKRGPKVGGVLVGMAQVVVVLFGFYLTGGSANPARWLGPWSAQLALRPTLRWDDHMVYWAGPALGALAGALVYTSVIGLPETRERRR